MLSELSETARRALAVASPSVVLLGDRNRRGCGIVFAHDLVATNAHNVSGTDATVLFSDGARRIGEIAGVDSDGDLAVLRVPTGEVPHLEMSPTPPEIGDVVFSVSRGAANEIRVSFGLVTAMPTAFSGPTGRRIAGTIEHSTPLPRGSSGSPLVDTEGRLVGINTHRPGDGFYQAIVACDRLSAELSELADGRPRERRRLGVGLAPPEMARALRRAVGLPDRHGILVRSVEEDSPAAAAGLDQGDLLVGIDGVAINSTDDLLDAVDSGRSSLVLQVVRGSQELSVVVTF